MHNFKVGDKVRVKEGEGTYKGWIGVEGVVEDVDTWMVYARLTTPATGEENPQPVDYIAQLQGSGIELIEDPVWKAGDLVEFYEEGNKYWQGGRGRVTAFPGTNYLSAYVDVEILVEMPLNEIQKAGTVVSVLPETLRPLKLDTWNSAAGRNTCGGKFGPCDNCKEETVPELALLHEGANEEPDMVSHPAHYGGDTTYEVIKVAEAWGLDKDAYLFNVLKYIARAGKKGSKQEDLQKADFYIKRRIDNPLEEASV